jgi:predicted TPR repeat methyltransferase
LEVALPEGTLAMDQDAEWCVVRAGGTSQRMRFHDYEDVYTIPGLYECLFRDILKCNSPATVRRLLEVAINQMNIEPADLRVLDLGAGNGMLGEELTGMGVKSIVGVDIIDAAAEATERDRPGVYEDYLVTDMAHLSDQHRSLMEMFEFNCLTCVAALGFGDIPPNAFTEAYNLVETGGIVAFNIKDEFLNGNDTSGFSELIQTMCQEGVFEVRKRERYRHRLSTNGDPLHYVAMVGVKQRALDP